MLKIQSFKSVAGQERVYTGEDINEDYSHDELGGISKMPDAMVEVLSTEEVSK